VVILTTDLLAGCYSMNFSEYKADAGRAGASGSSEVGEVASSQLDAGPDSNVVLPDLAQAPDSLSPGSMDLASPTDLERQSSDLAQDLPSGGPDLMAADAELGPDTTTDADGDAGILCGSGPPLFTDGFDQYSSVIAGGWNTNSPFGTPVLLDQSTYLSPPASALASLPANPGAVLFEASMSMSFGQTSHPPTAHLAFDVRIAKACLQSLPSGHYMTIGDVSLSPAPYLLSFCVEAGTVTTIYVSEIEITDPGVSYSGGRQPIRLDEWQHIDLQLQLSGQQPTGSLSVGDGPVQYFTPHPNASASAGSGIGSLGIGTSLMGPAPACAVNYDNVVFDRPAACAD
jgi:hypothetical protein